MNKIDILINETIENGSLEDLLNLKNEITSEKTNNYRDLKRINNAINERFM